MSADLVSLIAEVLGEHGAIIKWGSDMTYCECGEPTGGFDYSTDHDRHVAEVLVDRLGLHEERYRSAMAADDCDYDRVRYMSSWLPVGGQEVPR